MPDLHGFYPAFLTPLDENRRFAPKVAERLLDYLMSTGMDGIYVAGTTGEGLFLELETRQAIVETLAPRIASGKKLLVHVGAQDLTIAVKLAQHASDWRACAVSSLPPVGDRKKVWEYYRTLAQESPLPLVLYYFPQAGPSAFQTAENLVEICQFPNVLGVKFTDFNLYLLHQLVELGKTVFNGYDEVLAAGLLMGAQGGIGSTYNVMPQVYLKIAEAARRGDWHTARQWQFAANRVIAVLVKYPFAGALRAVMRRRGFDCGPIMNGELLSADVQQRLLKEFDRAMTPELKSIIE
jgi:N-acetylneuraminate lyase